MYASPLDSGYDESALVNLVEIPLLFFVVKTDFFFFSFFLLFDVFRVGWKWRKRMVFLLPKR